MGGTICPRSPALPTYCGWQEPPAAAGRFPSAAVSVDARPCAAEGAAVLRRGGNAVDAAVAVAFCDGLFNPQAMGPGGGFLMTHYERETGHV